MKDPIISKFAEACGATAPLDLRVDLADGGRAAEGSVSMPFTLVGRDDACDVTLADAEVNPRHAWLQVVNGRLLAVDLGSRTGLRWPGHATGSGWLDVGTPVQIGPFRLRLCSPVSSRPGHFPLGYSPLQSDGAIGRTRPTATLEFRNGKRAKDRWSVNRLVTLVGRAPECKIRLTADDIAGYHCGLVLTPDGLWVVDLSGRGVVVNGERMRVSPLRHGAELWVSRFLIGLHYAAPTPPAGSPRPATAAPPVAPPAPAGRQPPPAATVGPAAATTPIIKEAPEDEVPIGVTPHADSVAGLPSSHIMADAFRLWATAPGGSLSNPILVSGSGAIAGGAGARPGQSPLLDLLNAARSPSAPAAGGPTPLDSATEAVVVSLLRELGDLHGQMLTHFQQSLVLMVQLFACLRRDQLPAMQSELARIQELNSELSQLQVELARRAAAAPAPAPSPHAAPAPSSASATPTPPPTQDSTALHDWVMDRINSIQKERQARWQSLVGMFSGTAGSGQ